jgi:hypothetical protein
MSTKVTIKHTNHFHLYEEVFDDDRVFLRIKTDDFYITRNAHDICTEITMAISRETAYELGLISSIKKEEE